MEASKTSPGSPSIAVLRVGARITPEFIFARTLSFGLATLNWKRLILCVMVSTLGADMVLGAVAPRKKMPIERMHPEALESTRKRVAELQRLRKTLAPLPGLFDYRGIFHAHAEDSAHTGGTRVEMLGDAKKAKVDVIFLSDHYRPHRDFISQSWRGDHEGVLFIPGSETRGFLVHPTNSVMTSMDLPVPEFVKRVGQGEGLIFLSHMEDRPDHSMDGLTGMEIYNRHYDAQRDLATLVNLALRLTDPKEAVDLAALLDRYPDEMLAAQVQYSEDYLEKWDREGLERRVVGVAANDCHHNQVFLVKKVDDQSVRVGTIVDKESDMRLVSATIRPGVREMVAGKPNGAVLARLDFDPYAKSFANVSTHIVAAKLDEPTIRAAVRAGRAYVSHDWMGDPTGFWFGSSFEDMTLPQMGDEVTFVSAVVLRARFPLPCHVRWMRNGKAIQEKKVELLETLQWTVREPGVYRVEGWLELNGELRPWIYSNPIYFR